MRGTRDRHRQRAGTRRTVVRLFSAASLAVTLIGGSAVPALAASTGELESCFLSSINSARASNGASALTRSGTLSEYGRSHSRRMADSGNLFHSSSGDLAPYLPSDWRSWGENVGVAGGSDSCDALFQAFWNSSGHRANLLNPSFNLAGIGVFIDSSGTMWTTHVFVETAAAGTTTTTTQPPTTTTQPPPTTTTTRPPTTTTQPPPTTSTTRPPATTTTTPPPAATTSTTQPPPTTTSSTTTTQAATTTTEPSTVAATEGTTTTETHSETSGDQRQSPSTTVASPEPAANGVQAAARPARTSLADNTACSDAVCPGDQPYVIAIITLMVTGGFIAVWSFRQ